MEPVSPPPRRGGADRSRFWEVRCRREEEEVVPEVSLAPRAERGRAGEAESWERPVGCGGSRAPSGALALGRKEDTAVDMRRRRGPAEASAPGAPAGGSASAPPPPVFGSGWACGSCPPARSFNRQPTVRVPAVSHPQLTRGRVLRTRPVPRATSSEKTAPPTVTRRVPKRATAWTTRCSRASRDGAQLMEASVTGSRTGERQDARRARPPTPPPVPLFATRSTPQAAGRPPMRRDGPPCAESVAASPRPRDILPPPRERRSDFPLPPPRA
mmetsp:Transcript_28017/g.89200  ORF Transcript_28017/g.89200 Transcript_28017/m.89200 type:complete len:271 (+) Transcript_28017:509-1321(+)|eukprot:scaffold3010_cov76-Isochrysis_galbana.AAC.3